MLIADTRWERSGRREFPIGGYQRFQGVTTEPFAAGLGPIWELGVSLSNPKNGALLKPEQLWTTQPPRPSSCPVGSQRGGGGRPESAPAYDDDDDDDDDDDKQ
ncbi:hypothetical protein NHX12_025403 [Muraenolepis orangiensis]|uniref:Uncharacterized protein n=1 Tax=Muraenolepis orangiensis TaxID=630683 RepID=A0A9Q0EJ41_9TELE|nr:hypothetical protein NHX12_025403 [Muraenolepis orangiensis]